MANPQSSLPPGFRFHPTDEELILHYLRNKGTSTGYPVSIIADVNIYKFDPWDLPAKAAFGEKEWYFFSPRDRKYPNGARPNRSAASGYWKATGTDKPIRASKGGNDSIGVKKALVFYMGRPPKGVKTNWIMHEYRLVDTHKNKPMKPKDSSMRLDDWVLCRIYKKSNSLQSATEMDQEQEEPPIQDFLQPVLLPNTSNQNTFKPQKSSSFSDLFDVMDYSILTRFLSDNPSDSNVFDLSPIPSYCNPDQSVFNNYTNKNSNSNSNSNSSSSYLIQRLPHMDSSSSVMENQLKRQHSMAAFTDEDMLHPSKKLSNSCSFTTNTDQLDTPQNQFIKQPFFNQHLLLSSHLQFQR